MDRIVLRDEAPDLALADPERVQAVVATGLLDSLPEEVSIA